MYRVYKDFLRQMLMVLLYLRELGYGFKQAEDYCYGNLYRVNDGRYWESPHEKDLVHNALSFFEHQGGKTGRSTHISTLIQLVAEQLTSSDANNDRDLIDTIVRVLGLPNSRNTLAGSTLHALQRAILLPEELVKLKDQLSKDKHCASCGHLFVTGEMTCFLDQGNDGGAFCCARCQRPSYIASDNDPKKSLNVKTFKPLSLALSKKYLTTEEPKSADADQILQDLIALNPDGVVEAAMNHDNVVRMGQNPQPAGVFAPAFQAQEPAWHVAAGIPRRVYWDNLAEMNIQAPPPAAGEDDGPR